VRVAFDLLIVSDARPALYERVERALSAAEPGRVALLLREPGLPTRPLLELAGALRRLTEARGTHLLISDRLDIALAVRADGVHLPELGFPPAVARDVLGEQALIGVSRHSREGLCEAARQGADYATLSPLHAVDGKAPPLGHQAFGAAIAEVGLPVFALGGVRCEDVPLVLASGARGVAVMREVLAADDPAERMHKLLAALANLVSHA
jgi:thiamine-phosphate pyrophosphorylase